MKFLTTTFLCFFMATVTMAQKKLKMDIDKETGDTTYSTSDKKIYTKPGSKNAIYDYLKTSVYKSKNGFLLTLSIQTGRTSVFTIDDGSATTIQLLDGNTVTLYSINNQRSKITRTAYGCFIFAFYRLEPSAIRKLKASGISTIRVQSSIGPLDYEIKEKQSGELGEQLEKF